MYSILFKYAADEVQRCIYDYYSSADRGGEQYGQDVYKRQRMKCSNKRYKKEWFVKTILFCYILGQNAKKIYIMYYL